MNVCLGMALQVDQLRQIKTQQLNTKNKKQKKTKKFTHLCPRNVRSDDEFHISMPKNPEHHPPEIPLRETAPPFKQLRSSFLLPTLVFRPCIVPVPARFILLVIVVRFPAFIWNESWEHEDGLYVQFLERA